jgi:hypothetical protein
MISKSFSLKMVNLLFLSTYLVKTSFPICVTDKSWKGYLDMNKWK